MTLINRQQGTTQIPKDGLIAKSQVINYESGRRDHSIYTKQKGEVVF